MRASFHKTRVPNLSSSVSPWSPPFELVNPWRNFNSRVLYLRLLPRHAQDREGKFVQTLELGPRLVEAAPSGGSISLE